MSVDFEMMQMQNRRTDPNENGSSTQNEPDTDMGDGRVAGRTDNCTADSTCTQAKEKIGTIELVQDEEEQTSDLQQAEVLTEPGDDLILDTEIVENEICAQLTDEEAADVASEHAEELEEEDFCDVDEDDLEDALLFDESFTPVEQIANRDVRSGSIDDAIRDLKVFGVSSVSNNGITTCQTGFGNEQADEEIVSKHTPKETVPLEIDGESSNDPNPTNDFDDVRPPLRRNGSYTLPAYHVAKFIRGDCSYVLPAQRDNVAEPHLSKPNVFATYLDNPTVDFEYSEDTQNAVQIYDHRWVIQLLALANDAMHADVGDVKLWETLEYLLLTPNMTEADGCRIKNMRIVILAKFMADSPSQEALLAADEIIVGMVAMMEQLKRGTVSTDGNHPEFRFENGLMYLGALVPLYRLHGMHAKAEKLQRRLDRYLCPSNDIKGKATLAAKAYLLQLMNRPQDYEPILAFFNHLDGKKENAPVDIKKIMWDDDLNTKDLYVEFEAWYACEYCNHCTVEKVQDDEQPYLLLTPDTRRVNLAMCDRLRLHRLEERYGKLNKELDLDCALVLGAKQNEPGLDAEDLEQFRLVIEAEVLGVSQSFGAEAVAPCKAAKQCEMNRQATAEYGDFQCPPRVDGHVELEAMQLYNTLPAGERERMDKYCQGLWATWSVTAQVQKDILDNKSKEQSAIIGAIKFCDNANADELLNKACEHHAERMVLHSTLEKEFSDLEKDWQNQYMEELSLAVERAQNPNWYIEHEFAAFRQNLAVEMEAVKADLQAELEDKEYQLEHQQRRVETMGDTVDAKEQGVLAEMIAVVEEHKVHTTEQLAEFQRTHRHKCNNRWNALLAYQASERNEMLTPPDMLKNSLAAVETRWKALPEADRKKLNDQAGRLWAAVDNHFKESKDALAEYMKKLESIEQGISLDANFLANLGPAPSATGEAGTQAHNPTTSTRSGFGISTNFGDMFAYNKSQQGPPSAFSGSFGSHQEQTQKDAGAPPPQSGFSISTDFGGAAAPNKSQQEVPQAFSGIFGSPQEQAQKDSGARPAPVFGSFASSGNQSQQSPSNGPFTFGSTQQSPQ